MKKKNPILFAIITNFSITSHIFIFVLCSFYVIMYQQYEKYNKHRHKRKVNVEKKIYVFMR